MKESLHVLAFLGARKLEETTYAWQKQTYQASFTPLATTFFLKPARVSVFLTDQARENTFPEFQETFQRTFPRIVLKDVNIPSGKSDEELWRLFSTIADTILEAPEKHIVFDITHGFRSLPVLALLAAAYAQSAFNIRINAVLYGAYDAKVGDVTPMFDLSPMLALLEWAAATDRFNRTGDARYLSALLRGQQKTLALRWQKQPENLELLSGLGNLAGSLEKISQALRLIRPHEAMQLAHDLPGYVEKAQPALQQSAAALPFARLLDSITQTYGPLESAAPEDQKDALEKERRMIRWYAEREQWVQAAALAREWLISWVMAHLGIAPETSSSERHRVEGFVNNEAEAYLQAKKADRSFRPIFLRDIPDVETLLSLWKSFTDVRNDILHAGMRDEPNMPKSLIRQIKGAIAQIERLPLP